MIKSIIGIAFDCENANELADFYVKLTGWKKEISTNDWAAIRTPHGILMVFQTIEDYEPPIWPWENDKQQQMAHIDFYVDNLEESVVHALNVGAQKQIYNISTLQQLCLIQLDIHFAYQLLINI